MLKINDYKEQILSYYEQGKSAKEISDLLGFKYHQPVYNFFKKYNLNHRKRVYNRKYSINKNYFNVINSQEKAYILGFICADGHISNDRLCITISETDVLLLEKIKKEIGSNQKLKKFEKDSSHNTNKKCKMVSLQISSVDFVKPLVKMGLGGNKTYNLNSNILKFIPKYLVRHFLRGFFDGDGNVLFGKKYTSGIKYNINICGNEEFLINTYQKFFPSTNKMYYDKKSKQTFIWKISSKQNVTDFLKYLYENSSIHLTRKYKIYLRSKCAHLKPI